MFMWFILCESSRAVSEDLPHSLIRKARVENAKGKEFKAETALFLSKTHIYTHSSTQENTVRMACEHFCYRPLRLLTGLGLFDQADPSLWSRAKSNWCSHTNRKTFKESSRKRKTIILRLKDFKHSWRGTLQRPFLSHGWLHIVAWIRIGYTKSTRSTIICHIWEKCFHEELDMNPKFD